MSVRQAFAKAAASCSGVCASPEDFIDAQWAAFDALTQYVGTRIVPQPVQIHGLKAEARYVAWKTAREHDATRDPRARQDARQSDTSHAHEDRLLDRLVRVMRLPVVDVLLARQGDFSDAFLARHGVRRSS